MTIQFRTHTFQINGHHSLGVTFVDDATTRLTARSPFSGKMNSIDISASFSDLVERIQRWQRTSTLIQNVFPDLNADEREFLMTGITSEEWDRYLIPADHEDGNQIEVGA